MGQVAVPCSGRFVRQGKALGRHIRAEGAGQHIQRGAFAATAGANQSQQTAARHVKLLYAQAKPLVTGPGFANIAQAENHVGH